MGHDERERQAEAAFALFLSRAEGGAGTDIEAFAAERPELANRLKEMHAAWKETQAHTIFEQESDGPVRPFLPGARAGGPPAPQDAPPDASALGSRLKELAARCPETPRYTVENEVARGGMGVIYKVWDADLRRHLAMKVVSHVGDVRSEEESSDHERLTLGRFLEEAQIMGQLDHPGVVPVHELGVDPNGAVFFTMRMVRGEDLSEVIEAAREERDGWDRVRTLGVILRVCETLAYAHGKGVIHRDIKPSNIMVGKLGETYVMDWGLAKVTGRPETSPSRTDLGQTLTQVRTDRIEDVSNTPNSPLQTMDGAVFGTPSYMPPEQARGAIEDLGPLSDVYSVGALLYTLLTGRLPYVPEEGGVTAVAVLAKLLDGPPEPVHKLDPTVPAELVAICEKAMAREPRDRYHDMLQMAEDLRSYLDRRVVSAYEAGAWAEFRKWVTRNRGMAAAILAMLVLVLGGVFLFAWQQKRQVAEVTKAQSETVAQMRRAEANAERARRQSHVANLVAAEASLRVHDVKEARLRLEQSDPDLRVWVWQHLFLKTDGSERALAGHDGAVTGVALPSGRRVVSGGADGALVVWDLDSGEKMFAFPAGGAAVTAVAAHRSGALVAAAYKDYRIRLWNVDRANLVATLAGHEAEIRALAFRGDGALLASGATDGSVRVWRTEDGAEAAAFTNDAAATAVAFVGEQLAVGVEEEVRLVDAATGAVVRTFAGHAEAVTALAATRNGARLASGSADRTVRVWNARTGAALAVCEGHADWITDLAFHDGGERLASASLDRTARVWDAASGAAAAVLLGHVEPVRAVAFEPAGGRLVSGAEDGTVRVWRPDRNPAVQVLAPGDDFVSSLAFGPGTELVAGLAGEGALYVWDVTTGERLRAIPGGAGSVSAVAFSADGAWIAGAGEEDSTVRLFDASSGEELRRLEGHEASVRAVAFDEARSLVLTGSDDFTARLWDAATGDLRHELAGHEARITAVAFAPNQRRAVSASFDGTVRTWDVDTGAPVAIVATLEGPVLAVAYTPDGRFLATGGADNTIRVFDAGTGRLEHELKGHSGPVTSLSFNADGTRLASGGHDKTVRVWSTDPGELLVTLLGHEQWVTGVSFSKDGARIASGAYDGTVRVWNTRR